MSSLANPATPYAIAPRAFRFGALASAAEKRRARGEREALMAAFVLARLIDDTLRHPAPGENSPHQEALPERVAETTRWLASLALPTGVAEECALALGALLKEDRATLRAAWDGVISGLSSMLDAPSREELEGVSARLR